MIFDKMFDVQNYWHPVSFPWRLYSPIFSSWYIDWNFYIVHKLMFVFRFVKREELKIGTCILYAVVFNTISIGTSHLHGDCIAVYVSLGSITEYFHNLCNMLKFCYFNFNICIIKIVHLEGRRLWVKSLTLKSVFAAPLLSMQH